MNIFVRILVSVFVLIAESSVAYATCSITQGSSALPEMTLSTTVSAGNDLPVSGVLFNVAPRKYSLGSPRGFLINYALSAFGTGHTIETPFSEQCSKLFLGVISKIRIKVKTYMHKLTKFISLRTIIIGSILLFFSLWSTES
ncbi:hypothetical protein CAG64_21615 [Vibrio sp. V38_P2S17PM301]|uniref:hypothetical protein n=1 Tax=Vibrio sp. V38_P2S17PM301 TaxID=1938689 RepID=UPI0013616BBC|nr:hypothetical protein [Vibrio sp. V38_P2S17PM301]NAX28046.1 hypothetical protein [Vibrio sp. V38_P2S17PM301]